jgi:hypothetical protein
MERMRRNAVGLAAMTAMTLLLNSAAYACTTCGAPRPGRGCDQLVTLKHPDLKPGPQRRQEWKKCMANPDAYNL